jgi:hypothetical protein
MASNQHYIEKADLSISNLTNEGGLLVQEQVKEFMEILIEESVILGARDDDLDGRSDVRDQQDGLHLACPPTRAGEHRRRGGGSRQARARQGPPDHARVHRGGAHPIRRRGGQRRERVLPGLRDAAARKAVSRDMEEVVIQGDTSSSDIDLATLAVS